MNSSISVLSALHGLGSFQFRPHDGNLGDMLLDLATRQVFRRHGLRAQAAVHPQVVFGGGGRFVSFYGSLEGYIRELTAPEITRCIILPHSFHQVDELVRALDERHLVFCREQHSLDYCRSLNRHARFLPEDDMALHLDRYALARELAASSLRPSAETHALSLRLRRMIGKSAFALQRGEERLKAVFLPRQGRESDLPEAWRRGQDVSDVWYGWGNGSPQQAFLIHDFLQALSEMDVLVSDRLHVCLAGLLAGCEVYLLDNNYKKLSGVYRQSLCWHPRAHLLDKAGLPAAFPSLFEAKGS